MTDDAPAARYVFRVEFRLEPRVGGVSLAPDHFETVLHRRADPPGEDGWRLFRDVCWHGELTDPDHVRVLAEEALGVEVTAVTFSELQAEPAYLESLREAIAADLEAFRAASVDEVLSAYLGSSIRVVEDPDWA